MYLRNEPPWFIFLVHPRDIHDLHRWRGSRLLREYSSGDDDFLRKATTAEPSVIGEVLFGFGGIRGELVGVMRTPEQIISPSGNRAVADGLRLAADRGARVVGLGALTAPATGAGRTLMRRLPDGISLTTGNAYTAAVARHNVVTAADALGLGRSARVAVLGATGSVGVPASHLLVQEGYPATLIGRSIRRVHRTLGSLHGEALFSDDLADLGEADVVLVLTSAASALVEPEQVKPGAVIVDVTQPANISESLYNAFAERGVRVVPGGLVRIPGYRCTYDFALPDPGVTFACLAETYLMAKEGIRENSVGAPPQERALRMERIAERHGVHPASLKLDGEEVAGGPGQAVGAGGRKGD